MGAILLAPTILAWLFVRFIVDVSRVVFLTPLKVWRYEGPPPLAWLGVTGDLVFRMAISPVSTTIRVQFHQLKQMTSRYATLIHNLSLYCHYVYDRYVVHAPLCMVGRLVGRRSPYEFRGTHLGKSEGFLEYLVAPRSDVSDIIHAIQEVLPHEKHDDGSYAPVVLRLAWHCCATYDKYTNTGGLNGATMRFVPEITDEGNTGLDVPRALLEPIKQRFSISYSDLWTLAGKVAIESMGGPTIVWHGGRTDDPTPRHVPPNGRLPFADKGHQHILTTFDRMGFSTKETVALCGAHGLGRCHKHYSGWDGQWTRQPTRFSNAFFVVLVTEKWHEDVVPETGRVQYYNHDRLLMMLNTDMELLRYPPFRHHVHVYASSQAAFFADFAAAFAKLLELGIDRTGGVRR